MKKLKCLNCGNIYEIDDDDFNPTHQKFCRSDCQYVGEIIPDYIRQSTTDEEREYWKKELKKFKKNKVV